MEDPPGQGLNGGVALLDLAAMRESADFGVRRRADCISLILHLEFARFILSLGIDLPRCCPQGMASITRSRARLPEEKLEAIGTQAFLRSVDATRLCGVNFLADQGVWTDLARRHRGRLISQL